MKNINGVLTKQNNQYIIINNGEDINLSNELEHYYLKDTPLHLQISDGKRIIVNESGELFFAKDASGKWVYHFNWINIEDIFDRKIGSLIEVAIAVITKEKEESEYGQKIYAS